MDGKMLGRDFKEFLRLLNENDVRYLVVGGYALALYGIPRCTEDLDIWVCPEVMNVEKLGTVLKTLGFQTHSIDSIGFATGKNLIRLGYPPYRIEILSNVTGLEFEQAYSNRENKVWDGVEIAFLSREDLLANKRASCRLRDLADVEDLENGTP